MARIASPEFIAATIVSTPGFRVESLAAVGAKYLANAARLRDVASKAAASKSGKFRGYTAEQAQGIAAMHDLYASEVPNAARRLMA